MKGTHGCKLKLIVGCVPLLALLVTVPVQASFPYVGCTWFDFQIDIL